MRKSLVTLPMRIRILPLIKAIIGMTTTSGGLLTNHSPNSQCLSSTLSRILYFSLNAAMPLGVSTSLANLPIYSYLERVRRKRKRKSASFRTMDERPKALTSVERRSLRAIASKKIYGVHLNGKFTPILPLYRSGK